MLNRLLDQNMALTKATGFLCYFTANNNVGFIDTTGIMEVIDQNTNDEADLCFGMKIDEKLKNDEIKLLLPHKIT